MLVYSINYTVSIPKTLMFDKKVYPLSLLLCLNQRIDKLLSCVSFGKLALQAENVFQRYIKNCLSILTWQACSSFRLEKGLCDFFTLSQLTANPELTRGYSLTTLTGFEITGSRTTTSFRSKVLDSWPKSGVRIKSCLHYKH